ncbi:MAG TPA: M24 family metallopeptidase [Anaerolineales bacterium]|nr:M24 family metallopeptidase [Anaerolineales bacterium]HMV97999.1 M24 family metallopeptidase [Anaerolineales bacterium]HMX19468.1 M24 family metallopeptidase [Anaerolineales bacterium]HMX74563.1 M24 family metallopeptidase [Anaerolineales bacterium]HMZ43195.1 M24 family metallopeptidase [Anaerolineales bacterium]
MKSELDTLMQAKDMDAILIFGNAEHNPPMYYLTGGGHVSHATLIKKRGGDATLFFGDMERDEAAKSGLKLIPYSTYDFEEIYKKANRNPTLAGAMRLELMLKDVGVESGRVGVYGTYDIGPVFGLLMQLQKLMPNLEFIGEPREDSIFLRAMEKKDEAEVERIRKMGKVTTTVVGRVADFLTSCEVREDEVLLNENGSALTVGDVHSKIRLWVSELGAELPSGFIFAIGRDAGVPHSAGNPADLMKLGQTIVFDIYPAEAGGGYYYDFTRTWSLGYATPEAQELFDQVKEIYDQLNENFDLNVPFKDYQKMTCEYFGGKGHKTPMNSKSPVDGYVHSLGHGVGLNIHERPFSGINTSDEERLAPGVVITSEPGLYYPEKGMGFRIEDTIWVRPDGRMEILADYPYDFVLPMKKWKKK